MQVSKLNIACMHPGIGPGSLAAWVSKVFMQLKTNMYQNLESPPVDRITQGLMGHLLTFSHRVKLYSPAATAPVEITNMTLHENLTQIH